MWVYFLFPFLSVEPMMPLSFSVSLNIPVLSMLRAPPPPPPPPFSCREVQQLRPDVRASPHISFAVKAYSALNSNNYVRFFRLVKTASFLNACILHRYFNQIRARALQIILRSHTAGQKKVGVSVGFWCVYSWINVCVSVGNCMCELCVCL